MITELRYALKHALGTDIAERHFVVYPDDTMIVSYPRSGNTWMRFLIANFIYPTEPVTFANIERVIPDIYLRSRKFLKTLPRPRIIKSHEPFDPRYKRVLYIVRDPRDVAQSYYHYARKYFQIDDQYPLDAWVTRFVTGEVSGFGSWAEHVLSWLATRHQNSDFFLVRYEDMLAETARELGKVAVFLGVEVTPDRMEKTIERSSASRMRRLEEAGGEPWPPGKKRRTDIRFVRDAKAGGWKESLSEKSIREIETMWGPLMKSLGYELTQDFCPALAPPYVQIEPLEVLRAR